MTRNWANQGTLGPARQYGDGFAPSPGAMNTGIADMQSYNDSFSGTPTNREGYNNGYGTYVPPPFAPPFTVDPEIQFAWDAATGFASNGNATNLPYNTDVNMAVANYYPKYTGAMKQTNSSFNQNQFLADPRGNKFLLVKEDTNFTNSTSTNTWDGNAVSNNGGYTLWYSSSRGTGGSGWHRPFHIQGAVVNQGTSYNTLTSPNSGSMQYGQIHVYQNSSSYYQFVRGGNNPTSSSAAQFQTWQSQLASPRGPNYQTFFLASVPALTSGGYARAKTYVTGSGSITDNLSTNSMSWSSAITYSPNLTANGAKYWFGDTAYWNGSQDTNLQYWYEFGIANRPWSISECDAWMNALTSKYGY